MWQQIANLVCFADSFTHLSIHPSIQPSTPTLVLFNKRAPASQAWYNPWQVSPSLSTLLQWTCVHSLSRKDTNKLCNNEMDAQASRGLLDGTLLPTATTLS